MSDWSAGYIADIAYTYGYYGELNPLHLRLAFLHARLSVPEVATACELGYGQGLSVNLHAAASTVQWWGTDFNPAQAAFAAELAACSRADARLYDEGFADFCGRTDLPDFDFICLHGIWSWISEQNRATIVDFVRRKLRVGGALYISYNTMPGWASFVPLRHLLTEHAEIMAAPGRGTVSRIDAALEFVDKVLAVKPLYRRANPRVADRFKTIKEQNRHYLAHEYFNRDWHPAPFAEMARVLEAAKLNYACSAHYLDHIDVVNLTAEQQTFLKEIPDPTFRETVRDFMVNQQFRRDYWVKGARRLTPLAQAEALRKQPVILMTPRADVPMKVTGSLGEAGLQEPVYRPILDMLADHRPRTIAQIEQAVQARNIGLPHVLQAAMVLGGSAHLGFAQDDSVVAKAKARTDRLNARLMDTAKAGSDIGYLAAPLIGGGVGVGRFEQLFLLARAEGRKLPSEWVEYVWRVISSQGKKVIKEGRTLETAEENLAEITRQADAFAQKRLPVLTALGVV
jgi:hypothetical protein